MFDCPSPTTLAPPPRALAQTSEFHGALSLNGQSPVLLPGLNDTLVTTRRMSAGFQVAMINRAPLDHPDQLIEALRTVGLGRSPVILSPEHPSPELAGIGALPLITPAFVALLDLKQTAGSQREALHQKWRNRLNRAQGRGLRVSRQNMPLDPNHWLFAADQAQQRKRGYRSWPVALTLAYAKANKGQAKLFQAFEGTTAVAAILILRHGRGATYHISHTTQTGKALSAHNLLMWEVMLWLARKGCEQLDLGLINTEEAPGLARFKLGTGARLSQLGGTWLLWPPLGRLLSPLARWDRKLMSAMKC